jgi:hypothetical protein
LCVGGSLLQQLCVCVCVCVCVNSLLAWGRTLCLLC